MLLAWNYRNLLADGAEEVHGAGLSDFGRQVVTEMNRLGMLVDVSHLCEASFNDVLALTTVPVIASHSNSKAICDNERNLTDAQLLKIKNNGGVAGLNFYPYFLNNTENADIDDVVRHIEHICSVTGEDHIGIGADYDGIECTPAGLEGTQCIPSLFERLLQLNYSSNFIEKLSGRNFMRVIGQVLK
jgi:membrane dipeptidase